MILSLADDATGALEVGAQFVTNGVQTMVWFGPEPPDFKSILAGGALVIDTETRHLTADAAHSRVHRFARTDAGHVFKKTDSTLRGNIASEFRALLEAFPDRPLVYAPGYPALGRTVRAGEMFVDGGPLSASAFANDQLNPVREGYIPTILRGCGAPVQALSGAAELALALHNPKRFVYVCDGANRSDLEATAAALHDSGRPCIAAGAGAFAGCWIRSLGTGYKPRPRAIRRCLVINGSLHPASRNQIQAAGNCEWPVLTAPAERQDDPLEVGRKIADSVRCALEADGFDGIIVFGGGTLFAILQALQIQHAEACEELLPGVPLSRACWHNKDLFLISKAGGFGAPDVLDAIRKRLDT